MRKTQKENHEKTEGEKMSVRLHNMTDQQIHETVQKMKQAPCIVCGQKSTGYRKMMVDEKNVAILPVCEACKTRSPADLYQAMKFIDQMDNSGPAAVWPGQGKTYR